MAGIEISYNTPRAFVNPRTNKGLFRNANKRYLKKAGEILERSSRVEAPGGSTGTLKESITHKVNISKNNVRIFPKKIRYGRGLTTEDIANFVIKGTRSTVIRAVKSNVLSKKTSKKFIVVKRDGRRIPQKNGYVIFGKTVKKPRIPANNFFARALRKKRPQLQRLRGKIYDKII